MKGITRQELANLIESFNLPAVYYAFDDETEKTPPFLCWFLSGNTDVYADDENYVDKEQLNIELYTSFKDFDLEKSIETVLQSHGITYYKYEAYVEAEKLFQIAYESEVIIL